MTQTVGEFEEKTKVAGLDLVIEKPDTPVYIMADSRHFWRVIDNLMNNICKYAQNGTRVYINLEVKEAQVSITFRNTSKYPLNISSEELMERFVRGDESRNTEGSGLGLSIANSRMEICLRLCSDLPRQKRKKMKTNYQKAWMSGGHHAFCLELCYLTLAFVDFAVKIRL